ncbi:MAG: hypothetical protein ABIT96_07365 [Ferruginibacter sp.]
MLQNAPDLFYEALHVFTEALDDFNPNSLYTKFSPDRWSGGEIANHIFKSISGLPAVLQGPVEPAYPGRQSQLPMLKTMFLDNPGKMTSPVFILPGNEPIPKELLKEKLLAVGEGVLIISNSLDLSLVCKMVSFPGELYLTAEEWLSFSGWHMLRHSKQL